MIQQLLLDSDIKRFKDELERAKNIVLTCHIRPDGDAMGSTLALYHLLRSKGKEALVITPDQPPRHLSFLPDMDRVAIYTKHSAHVIHQIRRADMIICCDFNKPDRQGQLGELIQNAQCFKVLIDHHQDPDGFANIMFSFPHMSSTCELVFRVIAALGYFLDIDSNCATALATGIITDTRNLSVNCDDPELYIIMYELLKKGVDKKRIIREALEEKSLDSFKLKAYAMNEKLILLKEHKSAILTLSRQELDRFHYEKGDSEGFVNEPLQIKGITASYFLREDADCIKISARSIDNFPVNKVCEDYFGGGGHIQAAGGEYTSGSLDDCLSLLLKVLPNYDKYLKKDR
jgi:phosphoesterase RecJ-like protein